MNILFNEFANGGKLFENSLLDKNAHDYKDLLIVAHFFANQGHIVTLLPNIHYKDPLYDIIFKGAYERKCPDLLIDNSFYEFESYTGVWNKNKISHMLHNGLKQSDKVIIDIRNGYATNNYIRKIAFDMIKTGVAVSEVWKLDDKQVDRVF